MSKFTNFLDKSFEFMAFDCWIWFKIHKHLISRNWHHSLIVNPSNSFHIFCIFTSTIINLDVVKSSYKLLSMMNFGNFNIINSRSGAQVCELTSMNVKFRIICDLKLAVINQLQDWLGDVKIFFSMSNQVWQSDEILLYMIDDLNSRCP